MVCTEAHIYFSGSIRSQRAARNSAALNPSALVDSLRLSGQAIGHDLAPGNVAVARHHRVRLLRAPTPLQETASRESRRRPPMRRGSRAIRPTAYPRSALPVCTLMPTMSPGSMVSGTICSRDSSTRIGSPADSRRRCRKHKQPSRCNHRRAKRIVAWIHKMNAQRFQPFLVQVRLASQQFPGLPQCEVPTEVAV